MCVWYIRTFIDQYFVHRIFNATVTNESTENNKCTRSYNIRSSVFK